MKLPRKSGSLPIPKGPLRLLGQHPMNRVHEGPREVPPKPAEVGRALPGDGVEGVHHRALPEGVAPGRKLEED